jgi:hypothetical protein
VSTVSEAAGSYSAANYTPANTWEVRVLDGYSFSQETTTQEVGINEAGDAPVRGQRQFNTALNPAEVSFSTYIRPFKNAAGSNFHNCVERGLWAAFTGSSVALDTAVPATATSMRANFEKSDVHEIGKLSLYFVLENTTYEVTNVQINTAEIDFSIDAIATIAWGGSGIKIAEATSFHADITGGTITGVAPADTIPTTASRFLTAPTDADFIKNKLSSVTVTRATGTVTEAEWTVTGAITDATADAYSTDTVNRTIDITVDGGTAQTITFTTGTMGAGFSYEDAVAEINNQLEGAWCYIAESDSTIRIRSQSRGTASTILVDNEGAADGALFTNMGDISALGSETTNGSGTTESYNVPITGGSLTIDNGITYLTPEELGVVNKPIGSFTGTRGITGSLTAYLNTGTQNTGGLLNDLLAADTTVTHEFDVTIHVGGGANTPRASFQMPHANLVIPTVNVEDVISTEIGFAALGENLETPDELYIEYVAATTVA